MRGPHGPLLENTTPLTVDAGAPALGGQVSSEGGQRVLVGGEEEGVDLDRLAVLDSAVPTRLHSLAVLLQLPVQVLGHQLSVADSARLWAATSPGAEAGDTVGAWRAPTES